VKRERGKAVAFGRDGDVRVRLESGGEDVWVSGLVPGDDVEVEVDPRAKPRRARLLRLVAEGEGRRAPECAYASRCGGCGLAHVASDLVQRIKHDSVARAVANEVPVRFVPAPSELGYRRRARLHFEVRGTTRRLGYRPPRSNELVDIPHCVVLDPRLDAALTRVRADLLPCLEGAGDVRFALGIAGGVVVSVRTKEAVSSRVYDALGRLVESGALVGAALFAFGSAVPAVFGDPVERTPTLDGSLLLGTVDGFSQANDSVAMSMAETVRAEADAEGKSVLEIYAGHGHLSIGLAMDASRFVAVEVAADAAKSLERNLRARGLSGRVVVADAAAAPKGKFDVVVLDPPRTGAADAIDRVLEAKPARIVMASCDVRTLERDLTRLRASGYRVTSAAAFDMFPGTPHVESVVRLDAVE